VIEPTNFNYFRAIDYVGGPEIVKSSSQAAVLLIEAR
jgi:hypothetical protein